jgi:hypothetical protein
LQGDNSLESEHQGHDGDFPRHRQQHERTEDHSQRHAVESGQPAADSFLLSGCVCVLFVAAGAGEFVFLVAGLAALAVFVLIFFVSFLAVFAALVLPVDVLVFTFVVVLVAVILVAVALGIVIVTGLGIQVGVFVGVDASAEAADEAVLETPLAAVQVSKSIKVSS